jgi:hypothetical protein
MFERKRNHSKGMRGHTASRNLLLLLLLCRMKVEADISDSELQRDHSSNDKHPSISISRCQVLYS